MNQAEVLKQVRPRLEAAFGDRFRAAILYGSAARGDDQPDSDMDILVLLAPPVQTLGDIETAVDATYPLQLEIPDRPIHIAVADFKTYEAGQFALYRNVKAEGVRL